ncbi:MAG: type II secretion system GspH family protein [Deltaproteobacteria bacterium]|jgi:type IV pilus assembly protein PilA|nr:type II secretion system GspH family protein [Deltaproteobacteria bacterium]
MSIYPEKRSRGGFTLIEMLVVICVIGILAAVAIPQYNQYRRNAMDSVAESAFRNVALAENEVYTENGEFTDDYSVLVSTGALVIDKKVYYGPITLALPGQPPTFSFSLNHVSAGTTTYTYSSDSLTGQVVKGGPRVNSNCSSVP